MTGKSATKPCLNFTATAGMLALCAVLGLHHASAAAPPKPPSGESQAAPGVTPSTAIAPINTPAQALDCTRVLPADRKFCIHRNEAIISCRNVKGKTLSQCYNEYMLTAPNLKPANCSGVKKEQRAACEKRNKNYQACTTAPMFYFSCLKNK